jgi:hypothetical protein
MTTTEDDPYLSIDGCCAVIGGDRPISRATFYRGLKRGLYPPVEHPSPGISRVRRSKLLAALDQLIATSSEPASRAQPGARAGASSRLGPSPKAERGREDLPVIPTCLKRNAG